MDAYALAFGIGVALVLFLAWTSGSHVHQKLSLLFLFAWSVSNVVVELVGFTDAPLLIPSLDAVMAILVAVLGYRYRNPTSIAIFTLYLLVGAVHVVAFILHLQGTYTYYATLNLLFLVQLLTVGGSSAWLALHIGADSLHQCASAHPPRRKGVA